MAIQLDNVPNFQPALGAGAVAFVFLTTVLVCWRIIYCLFFSPLRGFPGPWYAACSSLSLGLVSILSMEPDWLLSLVKKYGKDGKPIRITPTLLFFYKASLLRDIFKDWDPKCNTKTSMYGHEAIGPTSIFTTLDGPEHKSLRKALGGSSWGLGILKQRWESRIDQLIRNFISNLDEHAVNKEPVILSNKFAEFAADIMTMVLFTNPWGFVENNRDERGMLQAWRDGLALFGLAQRWKFFRETVLRSPIGPYILPKLSDRHGNGWLLAQASREITERERLANEEDYTADPPDFLHLTLNANLEDKPLSSSQKLAHMTLLIQAGADTTGGGLGQTLRLLATHPSDLAKVRREIDDADSKSLLSPTVQHDETRANLPYLCACIRESLRLYPPITNLFPRKSPP